MLHINFVVIYFACHFTFFARYISTLLSFIPMLVLVHLVNPGCGLLNKHSIIIIIKKLRHSLRDCRQRYCFFTTRFRCTRYFNTQFAETTTGTHYYISNSVLYNISNSVLYNISKLVLYNISNILITPFKYKGYLNTQFTDAIGAFYNVSNLVLYNISKFGPL